MRARGLTLVEVLIASSMAVLLVWLLYQLLVPVAQAGSRTSVRVHMAQQATLAMDTIGRLLQSSGGSGISYLPASTSGGPVVLAISPRAGLAATGRQIYSNEIEVVVWQPADGRLSIRTWPPGPPNLGLTPDSSSPTILTATQLGSFVPIADQAKLLASNVVEFQPLSSFPPSPVSIMNIVLEKDVPGRTTPERFELNRSVYFRNR